MKERHVVSTPIDHTDYRQTDLAFQDGPDRLSNSARSIQHGTPGQGELFDKGGKSRQIPKG